MKFPLSLIIFSFLSLACARTSAQPKWSGRVTVSVSGDKSLNHTVESLLKRELRGLHDITVGGESPDFCLDVVVHENFLDTFPRRSIGYALSVVVKIPFPATSFPATNLVSTVLSPSQLQSWLAGYVMLESHSLYGGADLGRLCVTAIANFDTRELESARHFFQLIADEIDRQKAPKDEEAPHVKPRILKPNKL